MNRALHERLARRESGRRRVSRVTRVSAIVAAAIAVAFGVGFAHQPSTTTTSGTVTPQTTTDGSGDTGQSKSQDNTQGDSGTLEQPVQPPAYTQSDGQSGHSSSGGS